MSKRVSFGFVIFAALLGAALAALQSPFVEASYGFGVYEKKRGVLAWAPYPVLEQRGRLTPLVGVGKFGADGVVRGRDGREVELEVSTIRRAGREMWEVARVLQEVGRGDGWQAEWKVQARDVAMSGEIVDSKCWMGVMQPGAGRVHRECAFRCLRGGVPPLFVAADENTYWLVDSERRALDPALVAELAALRVRLSGSVWRRGNLQYFAVNLAGAVRE